jgi:hypothetical protein
MKDRVSKKLLLRKERLRALTVSELQLMVGGTDDPTAIACPGTWDCYLGPDHAVAMTVTCITHDCPP